jgi:hypothetical protein
MCRSLRGHAVRGAARAKHWLGVTNSHEFLQCVEWAGFHSGKPMTSENSVLYNYSVWLIGRVDHAVSVQQLREVRPPAASSLSR